MDRILIVYYSRTGTTRMVAERLAKLLEADIEEIRERKERAGALGFFIGIKDSILDKPAELISTHAVEDKDIVIIGMPVWADAPPPAIRAFVKQYDLTGKKIFAFCTHRGSGGEKTFAKLSKMLPEKIIQTLALRSPQKDPELEEKLKQWAEQIRSSSE